jgi:predicted transcriptional regulator
MSTTHGNEQVSDQELLDTFEEIEGPFVTAGELETHLPISRTAINKRLKQLWNEGRIHRKKPTSTMVGWWRCESQDSSER